MTVALAATASLDVNPSTALTSGALLGTAALLDSAAFGGWKDRTAFVLIILGVFAGFHGTDAARSVAAGAGAAVGAALEAVGGTGSASEAAVGLAVVGVLLVLLALLMLARDSPLDVEQHGHRGFHTRISCSTRRQSRLNPRIWGVGIAVGLIAPEADFGLFATVMLTGAWHALVGFVTALGGSK